MNDTITNSRTGRAITAARITCDCTVCNGTTILVPPTVLLTPAGKTLTPKKLTITIHNLVQGRKIFGYPVV